MALQELRGLELAAFQHSAWARAQQAPGGEAREPLGAEENQLAQQPRGQKTGENERKRGRFGPRGCGKRCSKSSKSRGASTSKRRALEFRRRAFHHWELSWSRRT